MSFASFIACLLCICLDAACTRLEYVDCLFVGFFIGVLGQGVLSVRAGGRFDVCLNVEQVKA
jgi:hypothetical protein